MSESGRCIQILTVVSGTTLGLGGTRCEKSISQTSTACVCFTGPVSACIAISTYCAVTAGSRTGRREARVNRVSTRKRYIAAGCRIDFRRTTGQRTIVGPRPDAVVARGVTIAAAVTAAGDVLPMVAGGYAAPRAGGAVC